MASGSSSRRVKNAVFLTIAVALGALFAGAQTRPPSDTARVRMTNHLPPLVSASQPLDRVEAGEKITLALALPLRNQPELNDLLKRLYDPRDPAFGKYLTPEQFTARFGPTQADYDAVIAFAKSNGLNVTGTHPNRALLDVSGASAAVERAFGTRLMRYQAPDGSIFRAPDANPTLPASLATQVTGVIGLDNAAVWKTHSVLKAKAGPSVLGVDPHVIGTGPNGGMSPSDIKTAYNLNGTSLNGAGQTLALFELDGYKATDITGYKNFFSLPNVPLQNVLVDGFNGSAGSGAGEVVLDIELQIALAPGAAKIIVYEGPNSSAGVVDTYNRIATDNLAKQISTSWGLAENSSSAAIRNSENTAFQQMAAQGQSIFAASGDSGAYDNGSSLSVDDPASQPYMTGVGGTTLATNGAGGTWKSEKTWNGGSIRAGGGGGGISTVWAIPSYQVAVVSSASKGSTTNRNVPDVALNSDPNTGYAIYFNGSWVVYGGTSCASPLWAAFTALVNQQRVANGAATLGFANPTIYNIGKSVNYATSDFHDIADNSTNLFYPAVANYDDATGWGTINGNGLLSDLIGGPSGPAIPAIPTLTTATAGNAQVSLAWSASSGATSYKVYRATTSGGPYASVAGPATTTYTDTGLTNGTTYFYTVSAVNSAGESGKSNELGATPSAGGSISQLLGNPGFENGSASPAPWIVTAGVIDSTATQASHSGTWKAWMNGYGRTHTDTLYQQVAVPSTVTSATLTFWLHIDSAESSTTRAFDTLKVQVRNASGTVLATLATYSNLNKAAGYSQKSFNLSAYKGQTIQIYLVGIEDNSQQTSFVVDDFALNVQ